MIGKLIFKIALSVILASEFLSASAQVYEKVEQITLWQGRSVNPIKVTVESNTVKYAFYASNDSYFPYEVELTFVKLLNLRPFMTTYRQVVGHGKFKLFELTVFEKGAGLDYQYSVKYSLADSRQKADLDHPYLLPLAPGKKISVEKKNRIRNLYELKEGDTIFSMRKGIVTALPDDEGDRIQRSTLEILHSDGTVAVYKNLDKDKIFVKTGEKVSPGDPLGIIDNGAPLMLWIYAMGAPGKMFTLDFKYAIDDNQTLRSSEIDEDIIVKHPKAVIEKEMTNREIKKRNQKKKE